MNKIESKKITEKEIKWILDHINLSVARKPRHIDDIEYVCPNCYKKLENHDDHCNECDQRIDWRD